MLVIAEQTGLVKGKISNPQFEVPPKADGSPDIATAIGKVMKSRKNLRIHGNCVYLQGALEVIRSNKNPYMPFYKPYTGVVPISTGSTKLMATQINFNIMPQAKLRRISLITLHPVNKLLLPLASVWYSIQMGQ